MKFILKHLPAFVAALIAVSAFLVWWFHFDTYHLVVVQEGVLYRDGNRSLREFDNAFQKAKPKTVICLVEDKELQQPEFKAAQELARANGADFIRIPIIEGGWPTTEQVRQFLDIVTDPQRQPVLYHDDEGIRRAGMMMAAYQESVLGFDDQKAAAAIRAFGHSERTIGEVRHFIRIYDGRRREITEPPATEPTTDGTATRS